MQLHSSGLNFLIKRPFERCITSLYWAFFLVASIAHLPPAVKAFEDLRPFDTIQVPVVQIFLDLIYALAIVLIARQHLAAYRDTFPGDRKTDSHLGQIIVVVFLFATGC